MPIITIESENGWKWETGISEEFAKSLRGLITIYALEKEIKK